MQFGAVLLVISGITLFAYVDGFESANIVGVVLSVGSAFGAALYKVSKRIWCHLFSPEFVLVLGQISIW